MNIYRYSIWLILGISLLTIPDTSYSKSTSVIGVTGTSNGDIVVSLSDDSTVTYDIFSGSSSSATPVQLVPNSNWAVAVQARAKKIALVDVTTGAVLTRQTLNKKSYTSVSLLLQDWRNDDKYEAVVIAKRKTNQIQVQLLSVKTSQAQLIAKDDATVEQTYVIPSTTDATAKLINLNNQLAETLLQIRIKSHYRLKELSPEPLSSEITLGDGNISTIAPQSGYIYLCQELQGAGGALVDGPWIHGSTWDYSEKTVTVDGAVSWSNGSITVTSDGTSRTITGNGLPGDHITGQFPISPSDDAYQYDHNPNHISAQSYSLVLPANPTAASSPQCVNGEVGIAVTGVAIFNGLDALNRDAGAHEIQDDFGGHPEITGMYHYHTIADQVAALSSEVNGMTLVGYAFDGFGIYGETEFGKTLRSADLDDCHGHIHDISWDGTTVSMYHYHATKDYPYTVGCFHGTPVTQQL